MLHIIIMFYFRNEPVPDLYHQHITKIRLTPTILEGFPQRTSARYVYYTVLYVLYIVIYTLYIVIYHGWSDSFPLAPLEPVSAGSISEA